jgi:hypothetical protein
MCVVADEFLRANFIDAALTFRWFSVVFACGKQFPH